MKIRFLLMSALIGAMLSCGEAKAAEADSINTQPYAVNSFWSDWSVQAGMDMALQNPCNHPFSQSFTKGRTIGIDAALVKEFSPVVGGRFKLNWNNCLGGIFENHKLEWIGPVGPNNTNHRDGGWGTATADLLIDLTTAFDGYKPDRRWHIAAYPRMGAIYNFALSTGSPLIGAGVTGTMRLSPRWSIYADLAYHMMSSGMYMDRAMDTGTGAKGNGFFDISLGVQITLDSKPFRRVGAGASAPYGEIYSWRSEWYVQAGIDFTFQNPYGHSFLKSPGKAMTFGIDGAIGKHVTPGFGFRLKASWGNGIFGNPNLEWLAPFGDNGINHRKGGWAYMAADVEFCLSNMIMGIDNMRRWDISAYPRMGLVSNFAIGSLSPLIGAGVINSVRLTDKYSLFVDMAYNMTTSEFTDNTTWSGGGKKGSSNGFFDVNFGVQIKL